MFWFDWVLIAIGIVLAFIGSLSFLFSNKFFDSLSYYDLPPLFIVFGLSLCFMPLLFQLMFNRCDSCQKYVRSDYCTACGSYVAADSFCSCGSELDERYSFCPSCGKDLEVSYE